VGTPAHTINRSFRFPWAGFFLAACLSAMASGATAQTYQGGVRGVVRDANGVVPGTDVALVNDETTLTRTTVTNDVGQYAFVNVVPGVYTLRASLAGFKTFERRRIRLSTQDFLTLDVTLEVGAVSEAITVTATVPIVETTNASVGTLLERAALETLPNVGRNPFVISTTAPNVIPTGTPQFVRQQDQNASAMLSLGGGPRRANNYLLDGVPIGDIFNRAVIQPSIEALEDVKVQVSTYDAELGRTAGGVFNATHRSGSNQWHGSALMLERPQWGTGKLFFARKNGDPKPDTYYHLWAGSVGGPLVKNRTFFWASTEGYKTRTTANLGLTMPTALERQGDFSRSPAVIYDPLTTRPDPARPGQFIRDPFPGNIIPANRINPVAANLVNLLPLPTAGRSLARSSLPIADLTNQTTVKVDHRLSTRQTLSGIFAWYHSNEPSSQFYGTPGDPGAIFNPRTVDVVALNDILTPDDRTVVALRYGYMRFRDDVVPAPSDAGALGFSSTFANVIDGFPLINTAGYGYPAGSLFSGGFRLDSTFYSHSISASLSRLAGRHTLKAGADYRRIGMTAFAPGDQNGSFFFTQAFTAGPNPNATTGGDAIASLLLGFPARGEFVIATPNQFYTNYVGGYVQDDFRLRSNVSVNLGVRYEFEQGLHEANNAFTVGFDRERAFPIQVPGLNLKGGLIYAGVDGYPTSQGSPSHLNFGPRGGIAWSLDARTVVRGGYGLFWAPSQIPQALNQAALGTRGFTGATSYVASDDGFRPCASCSLTNPFPRGFEQPQGAAQGLLTGAGGDIDFVEQAGGSAYVHQYSIDLKRELPGRIAASIGYLGSRSERLTVGGTSDGTININQLAPKFLALGPALQEGLPNPFFGMSQFGVFATQPTLQRGQLLRPYPQFGNIRAHRATEARARYNALTFGAERRQHDGWGLRANYTFSVRKDNQFGETNSFSANPQGAIDNVDLEHEFGYSLLDAPHRLNISGTFELPFGEGKRWLSGAGPVAALLGGWAVSAVGAYQSGFPLVVFQPVNPAAAFGFGQRPNVVPGVDPLMPGSPEDNYDATCNCIRWLNPAAWSAAPAFTLGDAPRTDVHARTPIRKNWDIALQKTHAVGVSRVTLRAELINAFDDPAFFGPRPAFGLGTFGQIPGVGGFPRTLQLSARIAW
jgi:trimeric autotransporter adhesin